LPFVFKGGEKKIEEELQFYYQFSDIKCVNAELVSGKIIIMVEDEVSTGGTANDTGRILKKLNAK